MDNIREDRSMRKKLLKSIVLIGVMMMFTMSSIASEESDLEEAKEVKLEEIETAFNKISEEYEDDTYYENAVSNVEYWLQVAQKEVEELTSIEEIESYDADEYVVYVNEIFAYHRIIDLLQTTTFEIDQTLADTQEELLSEMQLEIQQLVSENIDCPTLVVNTDEMEVYNIVFAIENEENGSFDFTVGVGTTNIGDGIDGKGIIIATTDTNNDSSGSVSEVDILAERVHELFDELSEIDYLVANTEEEVYDLYMACINHIIEEEGLSDHVWVTVVINGFTPAVVNESDGEYTVGVTIGSDLEESQTSIRGFWRVITAPAGVVTETVEVATGEDITSSDSSSDSGSAIERTEVFTDGVLEYEIGAIAGVSKFTVSSEEVTMVFDEEALASITKTMLDAVDDDLYFQNFSIEVEAVDAITLDESVQDLVGTRPVFDFSIWTEDIEGNRMQITDFGDGSVTITVVYELAEGESADGLVIYYIDGDTVEEIAIDSYDEVKGLITFTTTHFSTYAVGYEEVTADTDTDPDDEELLSPETGDTANMMGYMMLVALAFGGIVIITKRRMA